MSNYQQFLTRKSQINTDHGFTPHWIPDFLFDFQKYLVEWSVKKGRSAIFADCGLGKTPIQLVWAQNVVESQNRPVLIITPLAVSAQTMRESGKFGIECVRSTDGSVKGKIVVTNYERLHHFDCDDFVGVVCDESSAIKNFDGQRQKQIVHFMTKIPYRLLCTATAAPNDYIELGTSSAALGQLGRMDMLATFFKNDENSLHPIWWGARWRFKAHAERNFWRWVCSWARAIRKPSDFGFNDEGFELPDLITRETVVRASSPLPGELFVKHARTLNEQRAERRATLQARCEEAASKVNGNGSSSVVWCHLNAEADLMEQLIPNAKQISGSDSDDKKEETFLAFANRELPVLVTKPRIGAFGLNWQHCSHMTFFPSHSFEQYYQGVRRCWRFGQEKPVVVDIITTEGELGVLKNLQRKAKAADDMFASLVSEMVNEMTLKPATTFNKTVEVPEW
jgi:hypothetical protein